MGDPKKNFRGTWEEMRVEGIDSVIMDSIEWTEEKPKVGKSKSAAISKKEKKKANEVQPLRHTGGAEPRNLEPIENARFEEIALKTPRASSPSFRGPSTPKTSPLAKDEKGLFGKVKKLVGKHDAKLEISEPIPSPPPPPPADFAKRDSVKKEVGNEVKKEDIKKEDIIVKKEDVKKEDIMVKKEVEVSGKPSPIAAYGQSYLDPNTVKHSEDVGASQIHDNSPIIVPEIAINGSNVYGQVYLDPKEISKRNSPEPTSLPIQSNSISPRRLSRPETIVSSQQTPKRYSAPMPISNQTMAEQLKKQEILEQQKESLGSVAEVFFPPIHRAIRELPPRNEEDFKLILEGLPLPPSQEELLPPPTQGELLPPSQEELPPPQEDLPPPPEEFPPPPPEDDLPPPPPEEFPPPPPETTEISSPKQTEVIPDSPSTKETVESPVEITKEPIIEEDSSDKLTPISLSEKNASLRPKPPSKPLPTKPISDSVPEQSTPPSDPQKTPPVELRGKNTRRQIGWEKAVRDDGRAAAKKEPTKWGVDEVTSWIESIGYGEFSRQFRTNSIDGSALLELSEEHLKNDLGIKLGPALKIKKFILDLKGQTQSKTPDKVVDQWDVPWEEVKVARRIGEGAFGIVFRGEFRGHDVAIKKLKNQQMGTAQMKEFLMEVSIMKKLAAKNHPNIVAVVGICTGIPNLAILTEFYPLGCLSDNFDLVQTNFELMNLIWGMAKGLQFLHEMGIIHRDFASRNTLLARDTKTNELVPKLTDFGMSRFNTRPVMLTQTNNFPLKWSAPEMFKFEYQQASDVWSWATTVIEVTNKGDPYPGITDMDVAIAVSENKLRPSVPSAAPQDLKKLLEECWAYEPHKRPTFAQIAERLQVMVESAK